VPDEKALARPQRDLLTVAQSVVLLQLVLPVIKMVLYAALKPLRVFKRYRDDGEPGLSRDALAIEMLYMLITSPSSMMQLTSSLASDLCIEIMLSVASSPSIVALANAMPSIIRSRRMTTPARVDFLPVFLKLSAMPSTLTPFFSE